MIAKPLSAPVRYIGRKAQNATAPYVNAAIGKVGGAYRSVGNKMVDAGESAIGKVKDKLRR